MTKVERIHLTCPNCETEFDSTRLDADEALGPKHTDFHVAADWQHTLCYAIHVCRRCGFAGFEGRFAHTAGVDDQVRRRVWNEAERYYRRYAARTSEKSLEEYDGIDRADRAVITYLIGELWRRIGDETIANAWFDRVSEENVDFGEQKWVVRWAKQQQDDLREWFV